MTTQDLISAAKQKQGISTDKGAKTPHVEVGPEALKNYKPSNKRPDPSWINETLIDKSAFHYRWAARRKVDFRKFQGYVMVMYADVPTHTEAAGGYVQLGDTYLMKCPIRKYEETIRYRQEYWDELWKKKVVQTYNEVESIMPGSAFVADPDTGKEIN